MDDPQQEFLDASAVERHSGADQGRDDRGTEGDEQGDGQRPAEAVDGLREEVVAGVRGTEPVFTGRLGREVEEVGVTVGPLRQVRPDNGGQDKEDEDHHADDRHPVPQEPADVEHGLAGAAALRHSDRGLLRVRGRGRVLEILDGHVSSPALSGRG